MPRFGGGEWGVGGGWGFGHIMNRMSALITTTLDSLKSDFNAENHPHPTPTLK